MSILVFCANPECGDLLTIPETAAGREVRCPVCGFVQRIPADAAQKKPAGAASSQEFQGQAAPATPLADKPKAASAPEPADKHKASSAPSPTAPAPRSQAPVAADPEKETAPSVPAVPVAPVAPAASPLAASQRDSNSQPAPVQKPPRAKPKPAPVKPKPVAVESKASDRETLAASGAESPELAQNESAWEDTGLLPAGLAPAKSPVSKAADMSPALKARLSGRRQADVEQDEEAALHEGDWKALLLHLKRGPSDLLDQHHSSALLVTLGVLGLVGGTVLGYRLTGAHVLLGSYVGAGIGYAAGVLLALLLLLAIDQPNARRMQCLYCGQVQPADEESCRYCGWQMYNVRSYAQQCLRAGGFGLSNLRAALAPIGALVAVILIHGSYGCPAGAYPVAMADKEVYFSALAWLTGAATVVLWLNLLLGAVQASVAGADRVSLPARPVTKDSLVQAGLAAAALVAYSLPLVSLPLLPMLPLRLAAWRSPGGLFDYESLLRQARRQGQELAMLWLMLLLWAVALGMSELVLLRAYQYLLGLLTGQNPALALLLQGLAMAAMGVALAVFLLAAFRCIGLLGRHDHEFLQPPQPDLAKLLG